MRPFSFISNSFYRYTDPPSFKETPKSVEGEKGDRVTLNCQADGNPLEIVWVHDPIDRVSLQIILN